MNQLKLEHVRHAIKEDEKQLQKLQMMTLKKRKAMLDQTNRTVWATHQK